MLNLLLLLKRETSPFIKLIIYQIYNQLITLPTGIEPVTFRLTAERSTN